MYVWALWKCVMSIDTGRGYLIFWNWIYTWLWDHTGSAGSADGTQMLNYLSSPSCNSLKMESRFLSKITLSILGIYWLHSFLDVCFHIFQFCIAFPKFSNTNLNNNSQSRNYILIQDLNGKGLIFSPVTSWCQL